MSSEDRQALDPVDSKIEQLKGGGVGPMHVLQTISTGCCRAQPLELIEQGRECLPPLLHGFHRRRIALAGDIERSAAIAEPRWSPSAFRCKHCLELVELLLGCVLLPDAGGALD